jgi:protein-L-isoaspartate(D-aspartate) O-methyltransferase
LAKYGFLHASILPAQDRLGVTGNSYDRILVSASASVLPEELLDQLKSGGRLVIPIGDSIYLYHKDTHDIMHASKYPGFRFVSLQV